MHALPSAAGQQVPDGLGREMLLGLRDADDPGLGIEDRIHPSSVPKLPASPRACG
jgi:hypothetical protein